MKKNELLNEKKNKQKKTVTKQNCEERNKKKTPEL